MQVAYFPVALDAAPRAGLLGGISFRYTISESDEAFLDSVELLGTFLLLENFPVSDNTSIGLADSTSTLEQTHFLLAESEKFVTREGWIPTDGEGKLRRNQEAVCPAPIS